MGIDHFMSPGIPQRPKVGLPSESIRFIVHWRVDKTLPALRLYPYTRVLVITVTNTARSLAIGLRLEKKGTCIAELAASLNASSARADKLWLCLTTTAWAFAARNRQTLLAVY